MFQVPMKTIFIRERIVESDSNIDIFVGIREASDDFSLNFADDCGRINSLMENS